MSVVDRLVRDGPPAVPRQVVSWEGAASHLRPDTVATEEPLEIRLAGYSVAVTMRTPGDDFDLAAGFLYSEGILQDARSIASIAQCPADPAPRNGEDAANIVNINPSDPAIVQPERWQRNFFATSSCGVCGKASIDAVRRETAPIESHVRLAPAILYTLDRRLRDAQAVFSRTGGLHAAGLFDLAGNLLTLREDVGRHNAVDKIIGDAVRGGRVPLEDRILMVSGRASFEIMQKALAAGIPIVAAVSAPSSLAVDLARSANMTLIGFLRSDSSGAGRFNVYAGGDRIIEDPEKLGG